MSNTNQNILTSEAIKQQRLTAAASSRANTFNVTISAEFCKSTRSSGRLTDVANRENGTTTERSVVTSIKFIPKDFMKAVKYANKYITRPIVDNAQKQPDTGKRPIYNISEENNLFDICYQEMQRRHAGLNTLLTSIIENTNTEIQPDLDKPWTISSYGGWNNFKAECLALAGDEAKIDPDMFPYANTQDFIDEFILEYEAEVADPTKDISQMSDFAQALLTDNRISMGIKMFHAAIAETADAASEAIDKINKILPDPQVMSVRAINKETKESKFIIKIDATHAFETGSATVQVCKDPVNNPDTFVDFSPVRGRIVRLKHDPAGESPLTIKKLEGLARKIHGKMFSTINMRFSTDLFAGSSQMQSNTFNFMEQRAVKTRNYFTGMNSSDFPLLLSALESYYRLTEELVDISGNKFSQPIIDRLDQARADLKDTVTDLETILQ